MTQRLPTPGGDDGTWGDILNAYLEVSLASDGTLNSGVVGHAQLDSPTQATVESVAGKYVKPVNGIPPSDLDSASQANLTKASTALQLGGDIGGSATAPIVSKIQGVSISTPAGGTGSFLNASGTWTTPTGGLALYAPAPTGVASTDTAVLQALINQAANSGSAPATYGGVRIILQPTWVGGVYTPYYVTGLTMLSYVHLEGAGERTTVIQLANGANADVIQSQNFLTLTGTNSNAGIFGWSIKNLTIDGNSANNTSGRGIAAYGYEPTIENVEVYNCAGLGIYHEWGSTGAVGSDTLAAGSMEGHLRNVKLSRNLGGGMNWQGPSDSKFYDLTVEKNGPSSNSTAVGVQVGGNAVGSQFNSGHIWGVQHKYGLQADVQIYTTDLEIEGATQAPLWLRSHGNIIDGGRIYNPGSNNVGIQIGDSSGNVDSADNHIDTKLTSCSMIFDKDSGNSDYRISAYWGDTTKTLITGTPSTTNPNRFNISLRGGAISGLAGDLVSQIMTTRPETRRLTRNRWMPTGYIAENQSRAGAGSDLTGAPVSGKLWIVGNMTLPAERPVSNIGFWSGSIALAGTVAHLWFGMWDATTLTLLATTADDPSLAWAAETEKVLALATVGGSPGTTYTPISDQDVYLGYCIQGTSLTIPSMRGIFIGNAAMSQKAPALSIFPVISTLTAPSSAPNPLVVGGASYTTKLPYASIS